ncbi:MAG: histidine triad nucleotide-binding protein [Actinomycetota bacterium]
MTEDCLFCKIAAKELDSTIVYETDDVIAFTDINPAAPVHLLVIPRRHISSAHELGAGDGALLGKMFEAIAVLARDNGIEGGHRIVTNVGAPAGQSVHHVHFHLLGGRGLSWPPG